MTTPTRKFQAEFWAHALLYVPMLAFYGMGMLEGDYIIFALILQFFVGFFQVLNGLIHALAGKSAIHRKYMVGVMVYFVALALVSFLGSLVPTLFREVLWFIMVVIIPIGIATWFLNMTSWYHGGRYEQKTLQKPELGQEDILDDLMVRGEA